MKFKKFLVGSKLLNLDNSRDIDYVVIADKDEWGLHKSPFDYHVWSEQDMLDVFDFNTQNADYKKLKKLLVAYQYDYRIIQQDFPWHFDILLIREKVKNFLKFVVATQECNFSRHVCMKRKNCSKLIYHFAYNLFILQNNSVYLTPEQKEIIQKIHDCQMPIEYLDELERMLNELD